MKNIILKNIEKLSLILAIPCTIILLIIYNDRPAIAVAFLVGVILGVYRLKTLLSYIVGVLEKDDKKNNIILMVSYILSLLFSIGLVGLALYKYTWIGVSILFGLITIPIIIMIYSIWQGIKLYRSNK